MPGSWANPKTDWTVYDGIAASDLNRIENNSLFLTNGFHFHPKGFGFKIDNTGGSGYDGAVTVFPGFCFSSDGYPINSTVNITKNLNTWAVGNGAGFGGMASAVTVAAYTWYYMFIISDPTTGNIELMFDDNVSGTNVNDSTYSKKRYIGAFKTKAAGDQGSFDLCQMYSIDGETVWFNPEDMYFNRELVYENSISIDNQYNTLTLEYTDLGEGLCLPARNVEAIINYAGYNMSDWGFYLGFVSLYENIFAIPSVLKDGSDKLHGEFVTLIRDEGGTGVPVTQNRTGEFRIVVNSSGQIKIAIGQFGAAYDGEVRLAVRGYMDSRGV